MDDKFNELPFMAITISDDEDKIIDMNERYIQMFASENGKALINKKNMVCHPKMTKKLI